LLGQDLLGQPEKKKKRKKKRKDAVTVPHSAPQHEGIWGNVGIVPPILDLGTK